MNSTLRSIQHTIGNQPLKWPALGSADKYTTLLPLVWSIKPVFHLEFFRKKRFFAKVSLVSECFRSKKSRIQSYLLFSNEKKSLPMKKIASGKPLFRSSMSTRISKILSKYPPHHAFNFEAMKWRWTNFQMRVALDTPGNPAKQIRSLTWNTENRQDAISDF